MYLIFALVGLIALKYFEVGMFADISWWWVVGLAALGFIWFEFGEKAFGLDKRRAHESLEEARKERVKKTFGRK